MKRTRAAAARPTAPPPAPPAPVRRRAGLTWLALAALGFAGAMAWWWLRTPPFTLAVNPDRNILLVTIDTLRADVLGSYGGRAATPNLDRLAATGARFAFAHAHAVVTLPSHATILTGRYPYEHGIRDNTGYRLNPGQATAASLLKARGFATGAFVGGFPLDHRFGLGSGFDVYDDALDPAANGEPGDRERRADAVAGAATEFIDRQPGKWFTWVHVYDPHATYAPPAEWLARFPAEPYVGEVSWTDYALGALFDRLATQPRPTLVIVTSDHGESLGEHGELTHGLFAYESTLRVPLLIAEIQPSARARREAPIVVDTPVRHVDILPTLLESAGAPPVDGLPGSSLGAVVNRGEARDRPAYFEAMMATVTRGWAPLRGVLAGREKYIDLPLTELYDLASDPGEVNNLVPSQPSRVEVLLNTLRLFNMAPPGQARAETADTIERLRSLGYIGGGTAAPRETYTVDDDPKRLIEIEQTLQRAADAMRADRTAEAVALYKLVIAKRADTEDAYRRLALIYWRAGRAADAIATLEAALRAGVTQREVRNKLGQYLAESGQATRAIALLESDNGDDPDALIALGNAYQLAGRHEAALTTFRHLIEVDPASGLGDENLGIAQLQVQDFRAAETSLRRAIQKDGSLSGAYTALGVALAAQGRKDEAIEAWKRSVSLDGGDVNALFNLTINLVEAGKRDEARPFGARFIAAAPPAMAADVETIRRLLQ